MVDSSKLANEINIGSAPEGLDANFLIDIFESSNCDIIHVARDDIRLELLKSALKFFKPGLNLRVIPAWDCSPYELITPKPLITSERISSLLNSVKVGNSHSIYLTTLNAASQYLPPKLVMKDACLEITLGKQINENKLKNRLIQFGYSKTATVSEPGDYSIRGGIIDIFSSGADGAVRLDLFGDVVDQLRRFDPRTQLTIKNLSQFELLPISEVIMNQEAITEFRKNYRKIFGIKHGFDNLYSSISEGVKVQGIEQWLPLFYKNLDTIFDYFPKAKYVLDFNVKELHHSRWTKINEQYKARLPANKNKISESVYVPCEPDALYLSPQLFNSILESKTRYKLNISSIPNGFNSINLNGSVGKKFISERNSEDTNLFKSVFSFIKKSQKIGKQVIIAASSEGSRDRLIELFQDENGSNINKIDNFNDLPSDNNIINIGIWNLSDGFYNKNLLVISETDIFGERLIVNRKRKNKSKNVITDALSIELDDLVIHMDHGIGKFRGFELVKADNVAHECLILEYAENSRLFLPVENINLLSRYGQSNSILDKLGGVAWQKRKSRLKKNILDMSDSLIKIAAERQLKVVKKIDTDQIPGWVKFCEKFNYLETDDQIGAINAVIKDFGLGIPMDRLICGDVGFGKTEVAMRAAFLVAMSGMQVVVVTPTTLLSRQHFNTFVERFRDFPIKISQLSRFTKKTEASKVREEVKEGKIDILIGTHSILSDKTLYSDLGLLIIDEEQHFGVAHKEKLKSMRSDVHVLTLTATPIPRTLHLSLSGLKDLSIISTPPMERLAVRTYISQFDDITIRQALLREFYRGGQSFIVVPRIKDIYLIEDFLSNFVPELSFVVAHGRMNSDSLDKNMNDFYDRKFDILLATTIIESGLDIPTANTIIIHKADMFGLAQLYQLRGRVGRSKLRAYAYLTTSPRKSLTSNAYKRLRAIGGLKDLGAGFNLASQDLDLRGAGNLLGDAQSGHIREVGFELYHSLLNEAVLKMQNTTGSVNLEYDQEWNPQLNLGLPVLIPSEYVSDMSVRLELYKRLSNLSGKIELESFAAELIDRFGKLPKEINSLLSVVQIKALSKKMGINKIDISEKTISLELRENHQLCPEKLIKYINSDFKKIRVRNKRLLFEIGPKKNKEKIKELFVILRELRRLYLNS